MVTRAGRSSFDPISFTAVSGNDYWVLGSVACRRGRCTSILRTTDDGSTFVGLPTPPLKVVNAAGVQPTLRFADRVDGFAFVPGVGGVLYATHDGGATWHRLALGSVLGFATGAGNVYVVSARCSLQRCTRYRFERSPVSADRWRAAAMPFTPSGSSLDLTAHGQSIWLLGTAVGKERLSRDELARSIDGGATFVTGRGPCYPDLGGELDPTSAHVVWAVCPTGTLAGAWRSVDGGVTFAQLRSPQLANSATLAPASREVAVLARGGPSPLLRTKDGGVTWTRALTPPGATFWAWIGFTDADVGAAVVQTRYEASANIELQELWRTRNGGADWSRVRFR